MANLTYPRKYSAERVDKMSKRADLILSLRADGKEWVEVVAAVGAAEGRSISRAAVFAFCRRHGISIPAEDVWKVRRARHRAKRFLTGSELLSAVSEELAYNQETGSFTWKIHRCSHLPGDQAGSLTDPSSPRTAMHYSAINVFGRRFLVHRLVWLFEHGYIPDGAIDHKNRDPSDNRIENLRLATTSQNIMNSGARPSNRLGLKGVGWHGYSYRARITADGVCHYLGSFRTPEEARAAWKKAAPRYHGEFAVLES